MGMPQKLLTELKDFARKTVEQPSTPEEVAQAAKERWLATTDDLAVRGRRLKDDTNRIREDLTRFVSALSKGHSGVDFDEAIDTLRSIEEEFKNDLAPTINRVKATRKATFSMPGASSGERARGIAAVDHYIAALNESLEMLRDFRWKIMTIRADNESPGNAPVFDDPEELIKYLDARSG